jgi:hypothetical protein
MTTQRFTLFAIIMVAFVLFIGCKKENENKLSDKNPSLTIVSEIAKYSCQPDFKKNVYRLVRDRFDGDNNVLCKDIISKTKIGLNDTILGALQYYQQEGLYPQIYIPYFEEIQKRKTDENVIFINGIGVDESQNAFQGYWFDNDTIINTPFFIDEQYAMNHEVWVISINERVDENGNLLIHTDKTKESNGRIGEKSSRTGMKHECIKQIKCPNLSEIEGWINGAPELKCICYSHTWGNLNEQLFFPNNRSDINNVYWNVDDGTSRKMYYWDYNLISKYINFAWIELDNSGSTTTLTNSYTYLTDDGITNNVSYNIQIKEYDDNCGSYTPYYHDGCVGLPYETGLISWKNEYKTIITPIH